MGQSVYLVTNIKTFPEQGHDGKPRAREAGKMSGQKTMLLLPHSQGQGQSRRGVACTQHLFAKPPPPPDTLTPLIFAHFQTRLTWSFQSDKATKNERMVPKQMALRTQLCLVGPQFPHVQIWGADWKVPKHRHCEMNAQQTRVGPVDAGGSSRRGWVQ